MGDRIQFVDKTGYHHKHITHLATDAQRFTRKEVVRRVEKDPFSFFVYEKGDVAFLEVITDDVHGKYVRTIPDGKLDDNLLSLPACPPFLPLVA